MGAPQHGRSLTTSQFLVRPRMSVDAIFRVRKANR